MKKNVLLFLLSSTAVFLFSQQSFQQILAENSTRNFGEIVDQAEKYFAEKYPDKTPFELSYGEHRDGEYVKYQRWRDFWKSRIEPNGTLADLSKYQKIRAEQKAGIRSNETYDNLQWQNISYEIDLGVQIGLGRTSAMGFHPTDPDIFYVGAANGGIWKTTDGGANYIPIGDDLPYLAVSSIIVNQDNPDHIYIAISDRVWYGPSSIGVYKTTNGGATWSATDLSFNFSNNIRIYWMEADPNNPNKMWVGTSSGLWKTEDAFDSAEIAEFGVITDVKYKPGDSNILYYANNNSNRFYRSEDGGNSFQLVQGFGGDGYMRIVTTHLNPEKVYVSRNNTLHKSFDSGLSFTQSVSLAGPDVGNGIVMISPSNENVLFAGFFDMFQSSNDGENWSKISHWLGDLFLPIIHVDQRNAFINPLQNDRVYLCNDGGVYAVDVNNNQFTNLSNGLLITQFYDIGVAQSDPSVMSGGSQDNGNVFMENGGWERAAPTADGMMQAIDPTNANIRYNAIQNGVIYRFINGNRINISGNIANNVSGNGEWVTPYVLDPNNPSTVYAGYSRIYKSSNQGLVWIPISNTMDNGRNMDLMTVAPSNSERIYVVENYGISTGDLFGFGHSQSKLFVKNTDNNDWVEKNIPVDESVEDIIVDPFDENIIYITVAGYTDGHKIFKSTDAGDSWENISGSLPNVPCTAVALFTESIEPVLFVGTDVGVYYKEESDNDWLLAGDFPNTYITDIEIQESDWLIRVGTHGRGIFEGELSPDVSNVEDLKNAESNCFQVAPNPVRETLNIFPKISEHIVRLYDEKGNFIQRVEGKEFNMSHLSKGIYFLTFFEKKSPDNFCSVKVIRQ